MRDQSTWTEYLEDFGAAGQRLALAGAAEGGAGNLSLMLPAGAGVNEDFTQSETVTLPLYVPELAGRCFAVTGSGARLISLERKPLAGIAVLQVEPGGRHATMWTSPLRRFARATSEFNTHLAVHREAAAKGFSTHAIVHAQPLHLTFLSHVPEYTDSRRLSESLMRWQPEMTMFLPDGLACLPFEVPGSEALMVATSASYRKGFPFVVWAKHGVLVCSEKNLQDAVDLIEYAETAARYECLNLAASRPASGLGTAEIGAITSALGIRTTLFQEN